MSVAIRLRKQGRLNRPFFRLVAADTRSPRDGKYLETLGWYNPVERDESKTLSIDVERLQHWIDQGAQLSENAEKLVAKAAPHVTAAIRERTLAKRAKRAAARKKKK
ncbi:MAG: 30S ribosomal protein S16 [Parachlamydiales bacterium]